MSSLPTDSAHGEGVAAASQFYLITLVATYTVWLVLSVAIGQDFYFANAGARHLLHRPSWLPNRCLRFLHSAPTRRIVLHLPALALLLGTLFSQHWGVRLLVAIAISAFSLVDTSATHSHR